MGLAWSAALYVLACVRCALPMPWLGSDAARRAGLACCTPQPYLRFTLHGAASGFGLALTLTLTLTLTLALTLTLTLTLILTR